MIHGFGVKRLPPPCANMKESNQPVHPRSLINLHFFKILVNYNENTVICLSIGTPKIINFPFVSNGKLSSLGFPKFGHITVN